MLKKTFRAAALGLIALLPVMGLGACGAEPTAAGAGSLLREMNPSANGLFQIDGISFSVLHKSDTWAPAHQSSLVPGAGYPQVGAGSYETKGVFRTLSGSYDFVEDILPKSAESAEYRAALSGTALKGTNLLCLSVELPAAAYREQKLFFDAKECDLPWWVGGEGLVKVNQVHTVRIPLQHGGTLVLSGDFGVYLQDLRVYGSDEFDLQVFFSPYKGTIQQSSLDLTLTRVAVGDPSAVAYDPDAKKPARAIAPPPKPQAPHQDAALIAATLAQVRPLAALRPRGEDYVDPSGKAVRFWGMNLAAFYPDYALADKTADNLASLGINLVRLHHDLRDSLDWDPADTASLLTYDGDTRTDNLKAWDRFDYFNAKLRQKEIYLSVSMNGTRAYLPGDVSILKVSPRDDADWADAVDELNHWNWQKAFDPRKMLPVFDERSFLLNAEFAKRFLTHVNPYTGIAYGKDPQVLSVELINEFSSEYTLLCGNTFPEYWTKELNGKLHDYEQAHHVTEFDLYHARTPEQRRCFSDFCTSLDESYAKRMEVVIRDAGYTGPIEFSNLWRGDTNLRFQAKNNGTMEAHAYEDPLVVSDPDTFLYDVTKSAVVGKPLILGEFNHTENQKTETAQESALTMLLPAIAAYGSLQNLAGVEWFAWTHGAAMLGADGWGKNGAKDQDNLGCIAGDGPLLDHMRTAGIVFKNRYLSESVSPQTIYVDDSYFAPSYNTLMAGQTSYQPGWQSVHGFRKAFGPVPASQSVVTWVKTPPSDPTVSDTGQIVRSAKRRQLSFSAPKTEGFSGYLDGAPIGKLSVLDVPGNSGFVTAIAVTLDDTALARSKKILVSKTALDASGAESTQEVIGLRGLLKGQWTMCVTRPLVSAAAPVAIAMGSDGMLRLPAMGWNECELEVR